MKKSSSSSRSRRKSPRKSPRNGRRPWFWRFFGRFAAIGFVLLVGWTVYLDAVITSRFEGRRFEVPSRVYARPLELYDGAGISSGALERELQLSGFRKGDGNRAGTYRRSGGHFVISTRGFRFPDGSESKRRLALNIYGDRVQDFSVLNGEASPIVRLEPAQIGGIYPSHKEDRILVQLEEVPALLPATLMAVEDRNFYDHFGIAPLSIARAMLANIRAGQIVQGGSTLTQQLVKNFFLTRDQTLLRKGNEALMSILLELHYEKGDILETYLNEVYLGQAGTRSINGFGLASQFYFGESLKDLDVHQVALLVGMVKGPSYYNPRRHPDRATERRNLVISEMEEAGLIDSVRAARARGLPLGVSGKPSYSENRYPAYIDLVRRHLARDYREEDLRSEGLRIFTTLNPSIQYAAEYAVTDTLPRLASGETRKALEAALVVTAKDSGEVLALVGGRDPQFAGFNRALDANRPIGSLIKPFIYLSALEQPERYTLITPVLDKSFVLEFDDGRRWEPKNYDTKERGEVPLHEALSHSYNLPAVRVGLDIGVDVVKETLQEFGVTSSISEYPSMLLGSVSMNPVTVAQMYQGLATSGFNTPLRTIREVTDSGGEALSRYSLEVDQVADPAAVHLVQYAMQETMQEGTGRSAYYTLPKELALAGKTGTTDDGRDSWFAGFSGDLLAVAWVGRDDNGPTSLTGASGALPVWSRFMARVPQHGLSPVVPDGVNYHWVNSERQALTDEYCDNARLVPLIAGSEPDQTVSCSGTLQRRIQGWFEGFFQ
ncbi:penicillin-binding protein 1B [Marinobacter sp. M216]|uniref:Penicillin-binding protein 1B n=1 Tax=Marinobacter albus TaxID=3030833 RepID=A0ABT7HEV5_9GAMM|nr:MULTISPECIES: penicillin-binding protein 1B [unclassified Marinobacter]MBW7472352.1 penicillin-binding protein 1B [Marinobacter sp. F4218]MDK9558902.1 penicillin-binding protein 1B [Marinobacter sp. M216]